MPDLRMPDVRMPDVSRPTLMASVVVMAGVVAILVALLSSSSSPNSDDPRQSSGRSRAIEPVPPINPEDVEQAPAQAEKGPDPADPFGISFGRSARRDVVVRVTSNGLVNMSLSYRNKKKPSQRVVNGSFSDRRTFKGRYPMASLVLQIPGSPKTRLRLPGTATSATCSITIDGVLIAKRTTTKPGLLEFCIG